MKLTTARFHYYPESRTFSEEASTLTAGGKVPLTWSRLYEDAADVGVRLVSTRTGQEVRYYLAKEDKDGEGEVQGWWFEPVPEDIRKVPNCAGTKILIIND